MNLGLTADEVLTTTRAVRKRLDFDRPVSRELIEECVEIAQQAPSGSNAQGWRWMFVDDPEKKAAIADLYRANFFPYIGGKTDSTAGDRILDSAVHLAENFERAPVLAIPCQAGRLGEGMSTFEQASVWGSIIPAVWSFMLALRERGLGSAWTTLTLPNEREMAEIVGIPYDRYTQVGLFPVAYTLGTDFKRAARVPAEKFTRWNDW